MIKGRSALDSVLERGIAGDGSLNRGGLGVTHERNAAVTTITRQPAVTAQSVTQAVKSPIIDLVSVTPVTPVTVMSNAERQRAYRARKASERNER